MATVQILTTAGYNTALGIAKETTYGTAVAPVVYMPFKTHNMAITNKLINNMAVRKSKGMAAPGIGTVDIAGSIDTYVDADSIGWLLGGSMGTDTVTASGAYYAHTMKLGGPLNSFTISCDDSQGSVSQYTGCKVNQLDISVKPGDFLDVKFAVMGQTDVVLANSSLSPTFSTKPFFEYAHLGSAAGGSSVLAGVTLNVVDFTISLKNNLKAHNASTGGRFVVGIDEQNASVDGTFTINYDSSLGDFINQQLWGTSTGPAPGLIARVPLTFTFTEAASSIIQFTCGNITVSEATVTRSKNSVLTQSVKFSASESQTGAADDLKIVLINSTSTPFV
jgi:hypothetical protein